MKLARIITLLLSMTAFSAGLLAQATRITSVEPASAKVGDAATAKGDGLDRANVDALYLTDGTNDLKCEVSAQTATEISFKVPKNAKPGRWALMVLTRKNQLIEQPVKLTVE